MRYFLFKFLPDLGKSVFQSIRGGGLK